MGFAMSAEQLPIVLGPLIDPAVVIAGAGSGKTTLMAARMVTLIARGVAEPEEILGLTFTRKAASELAARVDRWLRQARRLGQIPPGSAMPEVSTYHSFAHTLVREHGLRAGIDPDRRLETEFALRPLAYRTVSAVPEFGATRHGLTPGAAVSAVVRLDSELAEHAVGTDRLRAADQRRLRALSAAVRPTRSIERVIAATRERIMISHGVDAYRAAKDRESVMDFADLMRFADAITAASPEAISIYRDNYAAVLLDEYQDTSVVQRDILRRLFGAGHPVLAVGDPKQSIYSFRGAAAANITRFPEHFPTRSAAPARVHALSANYRSGPLILATANAVAAAAGISESVQLVPGGERPAGTVEALLFDTRSEEEDRLVTEVGLELAAGRAPEQILVLASRNTDVRRLASALAAADVPVSASDVAGLWEVPEVQDVLAQLATLSDPSANTDLLRLLVGSRWRIGLRDLALLGQRAKELSDDGVRAAPIRGLRAALDRAVAGSDPVELPSLLAAVVSPGDLPYSAEALARFQSLRRELDRIARHLGEPLPDLVARVVRETGLDVELLLGQRAGLKAAAVAALISLAADYSAADPQGGLTGFLRALRIARVSELRLGFEPPDPRGAVRVMTVHKAKGLEAEVVFIPGMTADQFDTGKLTGPWPTTPAAIPDDVRGDRPPGPEIAPTSTKDLEAHLDVLRSLLRQEKSRLTYVAITRAGARLVVSSHHWAPGRSTTSKPSRHLAVIAEGVGVQVPHWQDDPSVTNPYPQLAARADFPAAQEEQAVERLTEAARAVWRAVEADPPLRDPADGEAAASAPGLSADEQALVAHWDSDLAALERERQEAETRTIEVDLPDHLSVTSAQQLLVEPERFALNLRRPMPRPPSVAAEMGTRFHDWVARRWQQRPLIDPLEGAADAELEPADGPALKALQEAFELSEFADRAPFAIEYPFTITLGGIPITGQIDAVYRDGDRWEVVDWKTGRTASADPLQLAIYRIAWARLRQIPLDQVTASFYYVALALRVPQPDLPGPDVVAALLRGDPPEARGG
jgi:DNA helicase-2/ATP-dependent DNA helicase PcrA